MSPRLAVTFNALALYAIAGTLGFAFYWQLVYHELPCPLCLLQRVALTALAVGPILTIRHGPKPQHYGMVVVAAVIGAVVAARQILLHIQPGDPGFGSPLWGLHFYTWAFLAFAAAVLAAGVMLTFGKQFEPPAPPNGHSLFEALSVWLVIALTALNAASVLLECGLASCPANPVHYELLR